MVLKAAAKAEQSGVNLSSSYGSLNDFLSESDYITSGGAPPMGLFGAPDNAACLALTVLVPADSVANIHFSYKDDQGDHNCQENSDCGWAMFQNFVGVTEQGFKAFAIVFKNWSADRNRAVRADVSITYPIGEEISQMSSGPM